MPLMAQTSEVSVRVAGAITGVVFVPTSLIAADGAGPSPWGRATIGDLRLEVHRLLGATLLLRLLQCYDKFPPIRAPRVPLLGALCCAELRLGCPSTNPDISSVPAHCHD